MMKLKEEFEGCARQLKALADPKRLHLIQCLFNGPCSVSNLSELTGEEIVSVSHHLGVLRNAGLVKIERRGKFIIYSVAPHLKHRKSGTLNFGCCQLDLKPS
jgi:ArsR family transcriptional regulator